MATPAGMSGTPFAANADPTHPRAVARSAALPAILQVRPVAIAGSLAAVATMLIAFSIFGQVMRWNHGSEHHLIGVFDLDSEKNVPTLFSAFLLFAAAVTVAAVAKIESGSRWHRTWWALALGFLLMSFDETFPMHERLIEPVRGMLGADYPPIFHFAWVIPGLVLLAVIAMSLRRFARALPRSTRSLFLLSATLYFGGAIGLEMVGGRYLALHGSDLNQSMIATLEESLEMYGSCLFVYAALRYLADRGAQLRLRFA